MHLPFALLPAMCGDQGRVAICGKFGGNATLFPLLNYHFEESFWSLRSLKNTDLPILEPTRCDSSY